MRDVSELQRARRDLAASLALARPDSPIRAPIEARMAAIDTELAERARRADAENSRYGWGWLS